MSDYLASDVERIALETDRVIRQLNGAGFAAEAVKLANIRLRLQELGRDLRQKGQQ
jgi:hypothetical protein